MVRRRGKSDPEITAGRGVPAVRSEDLMIRRPPPPEPLPAGTHLPLSGGRPLRRACWDRLPKREADRLVALAGERIEWWASLPAAPPDPLGRDADDRPVAVLIGKAGACFAEPRIDSRHRPVYTITHYALDAGSHRRVEVLSWPDRPSPSDSDSDSDVAVGSGETAVRARTAVREQAVVPGSGPEHRRVPGLGLASEELVSNLPVRAQRLLTAPFDADHPVLHCAWHYEGNSTRFEMFAVVLIGASQLTLAHGSRTIPVGHTEQSAHWSLVCRRATVRQRFDE